MRLIIVRHGETDSNHAGIIMGQRLDDPLNQTGRKQAEAAARELQKAGIDTILASSLRRARETAEIISQAIGVPVVCRDELKERDFGGLSGKRWDELDEPSGGKAKELFQKDQNQEYDYRPWGGESVGDVKARLEKIIGEAKRSGGTVLLVAHGGILRLMHHLVHKETIAKPQNASIHEFVL
jgi:broad specificity phosphatase PhoE